MLQKLDNEQEFQDADADYGYLLQPAYYLGVLRRRWPYFLIPFCSVVLVGGAITYLWPAAYFSEGKILVQSQLIPTELVRPTVTSAAQERIQVIDAQTAAILDTQDVSSYPGGKYLVWNISGNVIFKVTLTSGANALVSGLFLDPVGGVASQTQPPTP